MQTRYGLYPADNHPILNYTSKQLANAHAQGHANNSGQPVTVIATRGGEELGHWIVEPETAGDDERFPTEEEYNN